MPEAIVAIGEGKRIVGQLRFDADTRRQHSQFEFTGHWLAAPDCFALSTAPPLNTGGHFSTGKSDKRSVLNGCFANAPPVSWGIAKFTSAKDTKPAERVGVATLKLVTVCGLRASHARLELKLIDSDSPIALVR